MHPTILGEVKTSQASESRDVLVLLANRAAQALDLDVTCLLGQGPGRNVLPLERIEGPEQPHREGPGRPQSGSGRDVREADKLKGRTDRMHLERLANDRMADI